MITIGKSTFKRAYFNNKKPTIYLGTQLINPVVWDPSLTDKTSEVHIIGDVVLNGKTDCYSLTFEQGSHLTINAGARLRVWQGGITNNDCTTVNYLTIVEDAVNDNYAEFLLHPDVTVNNHPNATVEFTSRSYTVSSSDFAFQRFGIPTDGAITEITAKYNSTDIATAFMAFNYSTNKWENIGYINAAGKTPLDISKLANSFDYYQMQNNNPQMGTVVTMKGALVGNENPTLGVHGNFWNGYANSYMAPIKTELLLSLLAEHDISSIKVGPNNTEINASNVDQWPYIQPIYCQFLIRNSGAQFNLTLNYKDLVWDPSFEEVTPTRGLMKGTLTAAKPVEIDSTLDGSGIFNNPMPPFPPEHDEK